MRVPAEVVEAFRAGLRLYDAGYGGAGLRPQTVREARAVVRTREVSEEKARRMLAWFARHDTPVERRARCRQLAALDAGRSIAKAPALTAWLLWGGTTARKWLSRR